MSKADHGDVAIQFHIGEPVGPRLDLEGRELGGRRAVRVPVGGVVIEHQLGVDAQEIGAHDGQRVDLCQFGVLRSIQPVERGGDPGKLLQKGSGKLQAPPQSPSQWPRPS